jgi:hypothetical protein
MYIQPTRNQSLDRLRRTTATKKAVKNVALPAEASAIAVQFDFFDEMIEHLSEMPEKREDFLNEARDLLKDPNYPNEKQLQEIEQALEMQRQDL